jgi:hypothetical protein
MIIFIKKIKTKEGINSFDNEKIKKDIPEGYKVLGGEPIMTLTANHVLIAYKCEKITKDTPKPSPKPKPDLKPKANSKKIAVAKA